MDNRTKILIADDDNEIREVMKIILGSEGYEIIEAKDGEAALDLMDDSIGLVILDVMMPGRSGIAVCQQIRTQYITPVLFLTAKSSDMDKSIGFSAGGDDYLVKPFSYTELLSRVKAMLRRYCVYGSKTGTKSSCIFIEDLVIDTDKSIVTKNGEDIILTNLEYQILLLLASNRKKIFSIQNIYESIWNEPYLPVSNNTVCVHIRNIRQKLGDDNQKPTYIKNIWGRGYRID